VVRTVTAEEERYDLSRAVALDVTNEACTGVQSVAGIQKYASQVSIHGNDHVSLSISI
jgi:hypothetical protein